MNPPSDKPNPRADRRLLTIGVAVAGALLLAACGSDDAPQAVPSATSDTTEVTAEVSSETPALPAVNGYYDDQEIMFVHPEASDADIAATLETMMGSSPVIHVPALADVPTSALATVYVFTNGVVPDDMGTMGPLGFQADVFDSAPGDASYSPLRRVVKVTWQDPASATTHTNTESILTAEADGQLQLEPTDIVVNMPFLAWPGGQR